MRTEDMVRMANQIAAFFAAYPHEDAVSGVAGHIRDFWEPRMKSALKSHVQAGGKGLEPLVLEAAGKLFAA